MRIVFCWWTFEAHFAACWRDLAQRPNISLKILALQPQPDSLAPYSPSILTGFDHELLTPAQLLDRHYLLSRLILAQPDVIALPGWVNPAATWAVQQPPLAQAQLILAIDTPWRGTLRQRLGRFAMRPLFRRTTNVVAAGQRAAQLALHLGFQLSQIHHGMYGIDYTALAPIASQRTAAHSNWPQSFLYVGRFIESKGIPELAAAYRQYRLTLTQRNVTPWPLICCGKGPLEHLLRDAGPQLPGFIQPHDMPRFWRDAGAFVIASRYEPWCQALVEAAATGLPLLCTDAVGASVEMLRPDNGLVVPAHNPAALAAALLHLHEHSPQLPLMGQRSQLLAQNYSAPRWTDHWLSALS